MKILFGASLLLFLIVGDLSFPPGSWPTLLRLPMLATSVVGALVIAAKEPRLLGRLLRPPMLFFAVFAALCLVAVYTADAPGVALRYAVGYILVAIVAVTAAGVYSRSTLLGGVLAATLAKVGLSVVVAALPFAWWSGGPRFQGVLGNPNPMGATAALAFLLLMVHAWHQWPGAGRRSLTAAGGLASTTVLATTYSTSAIAAMIAGVLAAAAVRGRAEGRRARIAWLVVALALLVPLLVNQVRNVQGTGRPFPPATAMELRVGWWGMLIPVVMQRPWLGHGAGITPSLAFAARPDWRTSAHNLYLEAAVYAGVPAAASMLLFVAGALLASFRRARDEPDGVKVSLAVILAFYAVLSLVEPVVLNGAPSSLLVPLVAAAACTSPPGTRREGRR